MPGGPARISIRGTRSWRGTGDEREKLSSRSRYHGRALEVAGVAGDEHVGSDLEARGYLNGILVVAEAQRQCSLELSAFEGNHIDELEQIADCGVGGRATPGSLHDVVNRGHRVASHKSGRLPARDRIEK